MRILSRLLIKVALFLVISFLFLAFFFAFSSNQVFAIPLPGGLSECEREPDNSCSLINSGAHCCGADGCPELGSSDPGPWSGYSWKEYSCEWGITSVWCYTYTYKLSYQCYAGDVCKVGASTNDSFLEAGFCKAEGETVNCGTGGTYKQCCQGACPSGGYADGTPTSEVCGDLIPNRGGDRYGWCNVGSGSACDSCGGGGFIPCSGWGTFADAYGNCKMGSSTPPPTTATPTPTPTSAPTYCNHNGCTAMECCDSWLEIDVPAEATVGDQVTIRFFQHPGWCGQDGQDAGCNCKYDSINFSAAGPQSVSLVASGFTTIHNLTSIHTGSPVGHWWYNNKVREAQVVWNTSNLAPGSYDFSGTYYGGHSDNCSSNGACCDQIRSGFGGGYTAGGYMGQILGRSPNHKIILSLAPTPTPIPSPACSIKINDNAACTSSKTVDLSGFPPEATGAKFWNQGDSEPDSYGSFSDPMNWVINGWSTSRVWARFNNAGGESGYCFDEIKYPCLTPTPTPTPIPPTPTPLSGKTCAVRTSSTTLYEGENVTLSATGTGNKAGGEPVRLYLEENNGLRISPPPPNSVEWQSPSTGKYYYFLGYCTSSNLERCDISYSSSLSAGDYWIHCDLPTDPPPTKCTGNPFCSSPLGWGSENCSGWVRCSSQDRASFSIVPTPTPTPTPTPAVPSCEVLLIPPFVNIHQGETSLLEADPSVENGTVNRVMFSSGNSGIVTVNPSSDSLSPYRTTVTAQGVGETTIRAEVYLDPGNILGCSKTAQAIVNPVAAWFQTQGGNVYGQSVSSPVSPLVPAASRYFSLNGSWGQSGFVSAQSKEPEPANFNSAGVSQTDSSWQAQGDLSVVANRYNYHYFASLLDINPANSEVLFKTENDLTNPASLEKDIIAYSPDSGETMSINSSWDIGNSKKIALVNGNLTINEPISVGNNGFLTLIVNGDLAIYPGVAAEVSAPVLQGVYIVDGTITTAETVDNPKFIGEGIFFARSGFLLNRDLDDGNASYPAELFIFDPQYLFTAPKVFRESSQFWRELAP